MSSMGRFGLESFGQGLFIAGLLFFVLTGIALADQDATPRTPQDFYSSGQTFGSGRNATIKDGITSGGAQQQVPGYNTTPAETAHFGLVDLASPRDSKISECGSATLNPGQRADQECLAINLIRRAPSTRPQYTLNPETDPTITRSDVVTSNPTQFAGGLDGEFAGCRTTTQTTGAVYDSAVCNEYRTASTRTCERALTASVTSNGGDGDMEVLALMTADVWLYRDGTGIKARTPAGTLAVSANQTFEAAVMGTVAGTRLTVTHNGCVSGTCSGSASWYVTRSDGLVWKRVEASFEQSVSQACPQTVSYSEVWADGAVTLNVSVSCPSGTGMVTVNATRSGSTSLCALPDVSTGGVVNAGASLNINKDSQCWGLLTYRGGGAFTYTYWAGVVNAWTFPPRVTTSNRWESQCVDLSGGSDE